MTKLDQIAYEFLGGSTLVCKTRWKVNFALQLERFGLTHRLKSCDVIDTMCWFTKLTCSVVVRVLSIEERPPLETILRYLLGGILEPSWNHLGTILGPS